MSLEKREVGRTANRLIHALKANHPHPTLRWSDEVREDREVFERSVLECIREKDPSLSVELRYASEPISKKAKEEQRLQAIAWRIYRSIQERLRVDEGQYEHNDRGQVNVPYTVRELLENGHLKKPVYFRKGERWDKEELIQCIEAKFETGQSHYIFGQTVLVWIKESIASVMETMKKRGLLKS